MEDYKVIANTFAKKHGVSLKVIGNPEYRKYFHDDKEYRWVFKMRLQRNRKQYTFNFGQSIAAGREEPTMYDVLATLEKNYVGSFEDFCKEFGYDEDSISALKIYKAVLKESKAVQRLFGDVLDELQKIC